MTISIPKTHPMERMFQHRIGAPVDVRGGGASRCSKCGAHVVIGSTRDHVRTDIVLEVDGAVWQQVGFHLDGTPMLEEVMCAAREHLCPNR